MHDRHSMLAMMAGLAGAVGTSGYGIDTPLDITREHSKRRRRNPESATRQELTKHGLAHTSINSWPSPARTPWDPHMSSEKATTGMTGKQLRKARKRALKSRMRLVQL